LLSRCASGTNRRGIKYQRRQVESGGRWNRYRAAIGGIDDSCKQRIEQIVGKIGIVLRFAHAEFIFIARTNQQLIDQRITHALNLDITVGEFGFAARFIGKRLGAGPGGRGVSADNGFRFACSMLQAILS